MGVPQDDPVRDRGHDPLQLLLADGRRLLERATRGSCLATRVGQPPVREQSGTPAYPSPDWVCAPVSAGGRTSRCRSGSPGSRVGLRQAWRAGAGGLRGTGADEMLFSSASSLDEVQPKGISA